MSARKHNLTIVDRPYGARTVPVMPPGGRSVGRKPFRAGVRICPAYLLGLTLGLALYGYETLAPWVQLIDAESSTPSIALRAVVIILCVACLVTYARAPGARLGPLVPLLLFLYFYALRLVDNFYVQQLVWQASPAVAFGLLVGGGLVPAVVLSQIVPKLDEQGFLSMQVAMILVFLAGLGINWDLLLAASETTRASIDKLNPISLGALASSFALLVAIMPTRGWPLAILRLALLASLVGITAFAQSRGPIVATGFALLVFGLVARGPHRKYLVRATIIAAVLMLATPFLLGVDLIAFAMERFFTAVDASDAAALGRVVAWQASWQQFTDSPLIGDRVFEPSLMHYPHNLFLESLISLGLLGTLLLLIHLALSSVACLRLLGNAHSSVMEKYVALLALKQFMAAQFSGAIWGHTTFWIASACAITLVFRKAQRRDRG